MTKLEFRNVTVQYPVYNSRSMSLRNQLMRIGTGGRIESEAGHVSIVTALKEVSFSLSDGDAVALIGHNGAFRGRQKHHAAHYGGRLHTGCG